MFDLNSTIAKNDPDVVIHHKDGGPCRNPEEADGTIEVWMRPLNGSDDREISNRMLVMGKRGDSELKAGTMDRLKVVRSVTRVEGLTMGDRKVDVITGAVYDKCPVWILNPIKEKVVELNAEMTKEEESE